MKVSRIVKCLHHGEIGSTKCAPVTNLLAGAMIFVATVTFGCSGSGTPPWEVCNVGESAVCQGISGCSGTKTCLTSGDGWTECNCGSDADSVEDNGGNADASTRDDGEVLTDGVAVDADATGVDLGVADADSSESDLAVDADVAVPDVATDAGDTVTGPDVLVVTCSTVADCDDGSKCTIKSCDDHVCKISVKCDDGNVCTDDSCDAGTGFCSHLPNLGTCDDGLLCTENDICNADNSCIGTAVVCPAISCKSGTCSEDSLGCSYVNLENGSPCDDGNTNTANDQCGDGACAGIVVCVPDCVGKNCGDDGCGGLCGDNPTARRWPTASDGNPCHSTSEPGCEAGLFLLCIDGVRECYWNNECGALDSCSASKPCVYGFNCVNDACVKDTALGAWTCTSLDGGQSVCVFI